MTQTVIKHSYTNQSQKKARAIIKRDGSSEKKQRIRLETRSRDANE